jgi:hypothetical protein
MSCVHPDGHSAVFWGGARGHPRLWWTDGTGAPEPVSPATTSARWPAFDVHGAWLAYCRSVDPDDTVENLGRSGTGARPRRTMRLEVVLRRTADGAERVLTDGTACDERPAVSPDGTQVVYVSNRGGRPGLWRVAATGGDPELLVAGRAYRPWWSVDGARIFFFLLGPDRDRVHWVPAAGGEPVPLPNDDRGDTHGPYADPDGRHLLVHTTRDSEQRRPDELWLPYEFPLDGGTPRPLRPPGHTRAAHATRGRNGVITFDVARGPREAPRRPGRGRAPGHGAVTGP